MAAQLPAWTWEELEEAMSIFNSSDEVRGRHLLAMLRSYEKTPRKLLREILCTAAALGEFDSDTIRRQQAVSPALS